MSFPRFRSFVWLMLPALLAAAAPAETLPIANPYARLPLSFEPNVGQSDASVHFVAHQGNGSLLLTPAGAYVALHKKSSNPAESSTRSLVRLAFVGADQRAVLRGVDRLPGRVNYLMGSDPLGWRTGVPTYRRVEAKDLYPGIDVAYYGRDRQFEYDLLVAAGADPAAIRLQVDGAQSLSIDPGGGLIIRTAAGALRQAPPVVYQLIDSKRRSVDGRYVLLDRRTVAFAIGAYDRRRSLIIDPTLSYATLLGGSGGDYGAAIAADSTGNLYATGFTDSVDFRTLNPLQAGLAGNSDVFVTKFNTSGNALVYSTYLGGSNNDYPAALRIDGSGNAYVVGYTNSTNFPVANALRSTLAGNNDAFVSKLNASGSALVYSTYLGGSSNDIATGLAVASSGNLYVTGYTLSSDFPLLKPLQSVYGGGAYDAFVTKFNAAGNTLAYSTYLGGSGTDFASGIAVDSKGNAYLTGYTTSSNFPVVGAFQPSLKGGFDGFVSKLNAAGSALAYSTYLGGSKGDFSTAIAVGSSGDIFVTGYTASTDFPRANAFQSLLKGDQNAFLTKLDAAGTSLSYSTYLGGSRSEYSYALAVDSKGNAVVSGLTTSTDFPTLSALQAGYSGGLADAFVTKFNAVGSAVQYSTYLGGGSEDYSYGLAIDGADNTYVAGFTYSANFPTTAGAVQQTPAGEADGFFLKIGP
ncbi:SBBP repeat-containing protein [Gloeobacter kilaueensis]|nr:SBBP repeat-containing protein [Gloeobacter kilaueensis]